MIYRTCNLPDFALCDGVMRLNAPGVPGKSHRVNPEKPPAMEPPKRHREKAQHKPAFSRRRKNAL
jgi:hypothetical protein